MAVIVDKHTPLVQTHYGPGKMLRVIQRLQEESDLQSGLILDGFMEDRQIARKVWIRVCVLYVLDARHG